MKNPVFRLEGVVKAKGEMEDFEGPLELILQLLRKHKVEIKDISISLILEQYLKHLESMTAMDLEVASEFVAMASYLMYIKTKVLLSGTEEIDELADLISSLEDLRRRESYAQIKAVTEPLLDMYRSGSGRLTKPPEYFAPDDTYPYEHEVKDLFDALLSLVDKEVLTAAAVEKPVRYPSPIIYSVTEKAAEILTRIKTRGTMHLDELFNEAQSRTEMVAVFIAVLDLCRRGGVYLIGCDDELKLCASGPENQQDGDVEQERLHEDEVSGEDFAEWVDDK